MADWNKAPKSKRFVDHTTPEARKRNKIIDDYLFKMGIIDESNDPYFYKPADPGGERFSPTEIELMEKGTDPRQILINRALNKMLMGIGK